MHVIYFPFSLVVTSYLMQISIIFISVQLIFSSVSDSSANTAIIGLGAVLGLSLIVLVFSITLNVYCAITK